MKSLQIRTAGLMAALLAVLVAGCSTRLPGNENISQAEQPTKQTVEQSAQQPQPGEAVYSIALNDKDIWHLDENGNTVAATKVVDEIRSVTLEDIFTGETMCEVKMRTDITGEYDEYGLAIVKKMAALYTPDGNVIRDWEEGGYSEGFGDFIIRHSSRGNAVDASSLPEDYHTALWNYKTGEEIIPDVDSLNPLGPDKALLKTIWGCPIGVMNRAGEKLAGFPAAKEYFYAQGDINSGVIVASNRNAREYNPDQEESDVLLDSDLNEIARYFYLSGSYYNMRGGFIMYRLTPEDGYGILTPAGKLFYEAPQGTAIEYFDNERAILYTGEYRNGAKYSLQALDGKILADGFERLKPAQEYDQTEPSPKFLGIKDDKAFLIDRDGKILAESQPFANCNDVLRLNDDRYSLILDFEDHTETALLGADFSAIVPAGKYDYFRAIVDPAYSEVNIPRDVLPYMFAYRSSRGIQYIDILDASGKPIIENLLEYYDSGMTGIAAKRGFDVGLMDWKGNWIAKRSIFGELID